MFTVSYNTVTDNADAAQNAAVALLQHFAKDFAITVVQQTNMLYSVTVTQTANCYTKAVATFNNTVQQYCATVAQHIDDEDYPASCYVLDSEGHAVY